MEQLTLRVALAQINCAVGDLEGNSRKIIQYTKKAKDLGSDIVCFPELSLTGYPPEDLLLKPKFIEDNLKVIRTLVKSIDDIIAVVGFVDRSGVGIYNAAAVIYKGKICGIYHKMLLPNYGVFDEKRYFCQGEDPFVFRIGKLIFAVNICEDIWSDQGPTKTQSKSGAKLILNINASPFYAGKRKIREKAIKRQASKNKAVVAYVNLVGAQDELVFDGQSMVIDKQGKVLRRAAAFKEDLLVVDLNLPLQNDPKIGKNIIIIPGQIVPKLKAGIVKEQIRPLGNTEEVYQALVLGLRDYVAKNGFKKVVIGLSGGVDSALVAALAVDALGKENVTGVFMPSRYSPQESKEDAALLAGNLGIKLLIIPIEEIFKIYLAVLEPHFSGAEKNIAEENLQARIRGNLVMALSNKFGWLVLTTGNKSEMSTGYATLYGDMAGGFAVIKDVPKILVYELCRYRNSLELVIPERIFTKAPTAELKDNQKDSDTLGSYEILDKVLKAYVEEDKDLTKIVALGIDKAYAAKILSMVDKSEYKRRQAPPGIKITPKAFGRDRRMPITNQYRDKA